MLDPKEIGDFIRKYFTKISDEQFLEDYKRFCPEITDPDAYQGIDPLPQESEKVREQAFAEIKYALKKLIATYQTELPNNLVFRIEDNTVQAVVTFLRSEDLENVQKEDLSLVYRQKQAS